MNELRALFVGPPLLTLAVAESLTTGRVQAAIGAISGASAFFLGGITAYSIEQKVRHLGVDRAEAARCDAVSAAIAAQMAVGACRLFGSDFAVATTGYAEPNPARGYANPVAFWAIARRGANASVNAVADEKAGTSVDAGTPATAVTSILREGFLERPGLGRVAMQEAVCAEALRALVECVRIARAVT